MKRAFHKVLKVAPYSLRAAGEFSEQAAFLCEGGHVQYHDAQSFERHMCPHWIDVALRMLQSAAILFSDLAWKSLTKI